MDSVISADGPVSLAFRKLGIHNFEEGVKWVHALPYGRNSDRANYMLIFSERRGTCSTKHAALAKLGQENGFAVKLWLSICVHHIPEAHCYLEVEGRMIDVTFPNQSRDLKMEIIKSYTIQPEDIGARKLNIHQTFLRGWAKDKGMAFEEMWKAREEWISSLEAAEEVAESVVKADSDNRG